jgi:hypothetical protein
VYIYFVLGQNKRKNIKWMIALHVGYLSNSGYAITELFRGMDPLFTYFEKSITHVTPTRDRNADRASDACQPEKVYRKGKREYRIEARGVLSTWS